jgi:hypothetical protein
MSQAFTEGSPMRHLLAASLLALTCCSREPEPTLETAVPAAAAPAPMVESPAFITGGTSLRLQPVEQDKITDAAGKQVSNYLPGLYRGQQVILMKVEGDWAQLKTSDDKVGWAKADRVLSGPKVELATNLDELKTFKRPELASIDKRTLPTASVLLVTDVKDTFSKVNVGGSQEMWVQNDKLLMDTNETGAAVLVGQARAAEARKDGAETAKSLWDLAKSTYASTAVIQQIIQAPAAPAEGAPPSEPTAATPN